MTVIVEDPKPRLQQPRYKFDNFPWIYLVVYPLYFR